MALADRSLHDGITGLGGGLSLNLQLSTLNLTLALAISRELSVRQFAIGRLLLVAAAGEPCVHPWVRWGAVPGRRRQASKTQWAVRPGASRGAPVRIGAGAGRHLLAHLNAATPIGKLHATNFWSNTSGPEGKEKEEAFRKKNGRRRGSEDTVRAVARPQALRAELRSLRVRSVGPSSNNT